MPAPTLPFRAVVFDLDGTIIDSAPDLARALDDTLAEYGRPPVGAERVRSMVGDGAAMLVRRGWQATGGEPEAALLDASVRRFLDIYFAQSADPSCLFPGAKDVLEALAGRGVALGLCTNKPERATRKLLDLLDLTRLFSAVAGGDTLPVKKPDGGHPRWVVERLGCGPAAMVGDNGNDVAAARAAGLPVVAVSFGYPRMPVAELGADLVIDRWADLPGALARLSPASAPA